MRRLWIPLWWLGIALFDATKTVSVMRAEGMHHNWLVLFVIDALEWLPWALATWFIIWLAHRVRTSSSAVAWSAHLFTALSVNVLSAAWTTFLVVTFQPFGPEYTDHALPTFRSGVIDGLLTAIVFYALILAINHFFESRERLLNQNVALAQLSEQLAQAQLSALRHQIEPHFLFNALNSVAGLIRESRSSEAITMLVSLSDFLRHTLSESNRQEVPLSEELDFVQHYLATQKVRFAERLQLSIDVPDHLHGAAIPHLILQPLIENAIKHGIAKRKEGGAVRISATVRGSQLHISVSNDGPSLDPGWATASSGIGVANVRARLAALYGDAASFVMNARSLGGVEVAITLPFRVATV